MVNVAAPLRAGSAGALQPLLLRAAASIFRPSKGSRPGVVPAPRPTDIAMGQTTRGHYLVKPGHESARHRCGSCVSLLEVRNLAAKAWASRPIQMSARSPTFRFDVHIGSTTTIRFGRGFRSQCTQSGDRTRSGSDRAAETGSRQASAGRQSDSGHPHSGSLNRLVSGRKWINWHIPYHLHHYNKGSFVRIANKPATSLERTNHHSNLADILQCALRRRDR